MKADEQIGTMYVPEGETRTLRFVENWYSFRNSTLFAVVECKEMETESMLLLYQYQAEQLLLSILAADLPDPDGWVRVTRHEGGGWSVEPAEDELEDASDAM